MINYNEIWKKVQGFEGLYEVSNKGRVRSIDRYVTGKNGKKYFRPGRILSLTEKENGYLSVSLWKNNKGHSLYVHRLVGKAFIPNPNNLPTINHKDGNKQNNNVSNLEWMTYYDNNEHAIKHGLRHDNHNNKKMSTRVIAETLDGKMKKEFPSMREAERELHLANGSVHIAIKKGWHYHGLRWRVA